jgi:hypothetical protein
MTTDEILSAFIDGELPAEEMEEVRREIEKSAALAARVEALKNADRAVASIYQAIDNEPMPQSVLDLLAAKDGAAASSNVVSFAPRRAGGGARYWPAALAASVALAAGIGLGVQFSAGGALIAGTIDEGNPLFAALETTPSAETVKLSSGRGATFTPVLSFRSQAGDICREFSLSSGARANRAVACRGEGEWTIEFAVAAAPPATDSGAYATASSGLNAAFDSFVDGLIANEPFAPEEEAALIEAGWKADG